MADTPMDQAGVSDADDTEPVAEAYEPEASLDAGGTTDNAREDLRELVTYLATNLVDAPEDVRVLVERRGSAVHLQLRVPEDELGKVIGRQGRIARAMRTAVMIAGARHDVRASLDIEG